MINESLSDVVIALEVAVSVSYFVEVLSEVVVESLTDVATGVVVSLEVVVPVSYFVELLSEVVVESLTDVATGVVVGSEIVVPVAYVVDVFSNVAVKALAVDIAVKVLSGVNINASAAVMTALEFPVPIPKEECSC